MSFQPNSGANLRRLYAKSAYILRKTCAAKLLTDESSTEFWRKSCAIYTQNLRITYAKPAQQDFFRTVTCFYASPKSF
jgi:hypothetical protein